MAEAKSKNTKGLAIPICAGAVNDIVRRPYVCPRCGGTEGDPCGDIRASVYQIATDFATFGSEANDIQL